MEKDRICLKFQHLFVNLDVRLFIHLYFQRVEIKIKYGFIHRN